MEEHDPEENKDHQPEENYWISCQRKRPVIRLLSFLLVMLVVLECLCLIASPACSIAFIPWLGVSNLSLLIL